MGKKIDLTGQRFGRLVVVREGEPRRYKNVSRTRWECKCDCGRQRLVDSQSLRQGLTKSCGCYLAGILREEKVTDKIIASKRKTDLVENTSLSLLTQKLPAHNKSGHIGVCYIKRIGMWEASLVFQGERVLSKRFTNKQDAVKARKEAEYKYFKPILEKYGKESK